MDPQLTKQLNRRRLILENSLDTTIKDDKTVKNTELSSTVINDTIALNNEKNNFLEKIKKFESFSDNQIKVTQQNIVDKFRINNELVNKINKLNLDSGLKKTVIKNKVEFDSSSNLINDNKQKQDGFHEKIKQFESSIELENTILKEYTSIVKDHSQTSNKSNKTLKSKFCSKSDYNNWKLDKNWTFFKNYPNLIITKNILKNISLRKKEKITGNVHNSTQIFSKK